MQRCLHFHDEVHIRLPVDITRGPVLWRRRVVRPKLHEPNNRQIPSPFDLSGIPSSFPASVKTLKTLRSCNGFHMPELSTEVQESHRAPQSWQPQSLGKNVSCQRLPNMRPEQG